MANENKISAEMDISLIILNYNSRDLTLNCIKSIKKADFENLKFEIIVVDNNSTEQIKDDVDILGVRFIQNRKNIGMGAGNNAGIKAADGKYIVVMNPDTIAQKDTFKNLFAFMEVNPTVGMAGPKQYYPDGTVQGSCYRWYGFLTPLYRRTPIGKLDFARKRIDHFLMKDFDHNKLKEVDWLLGSFLFCRSKALEEAGYFDERFFMYFEDTDLAKKFWQRGWKVVYFPEAQIIHNHARQSARLPWYKFFLNRVARQHVISWLKYLKKWGVR